MNVTTPSTSADDAQRARRLPPDLLHRTNVLLAELERLRAQPDPDKAAAKKARMAHARESRTRDLHAAIDVVIESHKPQVVSWTGSRRSRAEWLKRLIGDTAPGWRYIDDYLKTLHF